MTRVISFKMSIFFMNSVVSVKTFLIPKEWFQSIVIQSCRLKLANRCLGVCDSVNPDSDPILEGEGGWRKYRRWERRPTSLKEAFVRFFQRNGLVYEDFWALKDVSFSLQRGEAVGICGGNGSGKSTLLKVLANILPMTHGRVTVRGRVTT